MPVLSVEAVTIINFITFGAFVFLAAVLIYLGRSTDPKKKITMPWVNLSFGVLLTGVGYLVQAGRLLQYFTEDITIVSSYLLILVGALLIFASFSLLYTERTAELNNLKKRHDQIRKIMNRLKQKYFARELPEEDLKKMYSELIREMTEIEVKLGETKSKS